MRENWGSKIGFILAAAGSAVGLGNVWKFPYETGANGGAAFIIIYLVFIILLGLPIMIAELTVGRLTGKDPVGAFKKLVGGTNWELIGYLGVTAGFLILSFYSVVGGWTLGYVVKSITGAVSSIKDVETAGNAFSEFSRNPYLALTYHFLFMFFCITIVIRGIKKGIERWSKVLMPLLFVLLIVLIIKGLTMEGSFKGIVFLLQPDFSKITVDTVISALGHSFFTLSLGMGAMITYGSYLAKNEKILHSAIYIVALDTFIAILAGFAIFPAVFAMNMSPAGGPALIFHTIPAIFGNMDYGSVFAFIFFILLFIAALTSGISLLEVVVAYLIDEKGWSRKKAVLVIGSAIFLFGIPSALSFGPLKDFIVFPGNTFFDFINNLTSLYMLPIGGLLIAVCLGWKYGLEKTMHELDPDTRIISLKELWGFTIKFISPVLLLFVFLSKIRDLFK